MSLACTAVVEHGTVVRELFFFRFVTFSALTLLVGSLGCQDGHLTCYNFCFKTPWDGG